MSARSLLFFFLLLISIAASAAVPTTNAAPPAAKTCVQLCADAKAKVKSDSKNVESEYSVWERRLGTKGEVVRYGHGASAAEGLLDYMVSFQTRPKRDDNARALITFLMARCFPEAFVNTEEARLPSIVETLWVANHTSLTDSILSCQ